MVQSDRYNKSRIATVVVLPITSSTALARHPGNVFVPAPASGLPKDSVVNVSQPMTVDRADIEPTGLVLPENLMEPSTPVTGESWICDAFIHEERAAA